LRDLSKAGIAFAAILGVAVLARIGLLLALPYGQMVSHRLEGLNDEPAHLNYVRYLVEHRALPIQMGHVREAGAFERGDFEYYQPPLYYMICAPFVAVAGESRALVLCRAVSLAFGLLSLPVLARILSLLGLSVWERRAGVSFAALLPVHAYFSSLVSNDSLCWLMSLLITHELLARVREAPAGRRAPGSGGIEADLRLGVLLGTGMLTKSAIAAFFPVTLLVYGLLLRREPERRVMIGAGLAIVVSLLIAGPWYMRNLLLYGSPFALEVGFGPPVPGRWSLVAQAHAISGTVRYFWFPMQHVPRIPAVVTLRYLELLLAAFHTGALIWFLRRRGPLAATQIVALAILAFAFTGHIALNLRWGEAEGRFLLPALGSIVYVIAAPVFALATNRPLGERLAWGYIVLLAVHPWLYLAFV
jgi:4-amino-4-deoxy-L-arabinose transferase-like glycosyltransferase